MMPAVREKDEISSNPIPYILAGISIGFFSGLLGIGGGVIGIPIMLIFLNFDMRKAVGTSAAVDNFYFFWRVDRIYSQRLGTARTSSLLSWIHKSY